MRPLGLSLSLVVALLLGVPMSVNAVDYPARDAGYHSYQEMVAVAQAAVADHPAIVRTLSIGRSHEGRKIWAAEISDAVGVDEGEPEVLFDGLHHAREHLSAEQAIDMLELLTNKYGKPGKMGRRVTKLVNQRRIWIVFMLNPDGLVHDLGSSRYRSWRKNRQPNAGSGRIGTDLNRNWGYRFGCCNGSSGDPASDTYRGPAAWSAPETRALRDFVKSRVIEGRQRIRTHVSFHAAGELVLWPYAYTRADIPGDMTRLDQRAFKTMGKAMAARNGYRALQSSAAFRTDGDMIDWMYGRQRIFSYTFELFPRGGSARQRHYPRDEIIGRETKRNRTALLYLIKRASCPYSELGARAKARYCGPFFDDLEIDRGWTIDPEGKDTATSGHWVRSKPSKSKRQLGSTSSGRHVLITGRRAGRDVDGGSTTVRSPRFDVPATGTTRVHLDYWVGLGPAAEPDDGLRVYLVDESGARVATLLKVVGGEGGRAPSWQRLRAAIPAELRGQTLMLELKATDGGKDVTVEAAIDQVRVSLD